MADVQDKLPMSGYGEIARTWLTRFAQAIDRRERGVLADLLVASPHWRDLLAFTWEIGWVAGAGAIEDGLFCGADAAGVSGIRLAAGRTAPRLITALGRPLIEVFFEFETAVGPGAGIARLDPDERGPYGPRAWTLLTALEAVRDHEEPAPGTRAAGLGFESRDQRLSWADQRAERAWFNDREPAVLVVGGGHSGVMLAARLGRLGIDTLVVDRFERPGDNWRTRYRLLALHTPTDAGRFPYLPFPDSFPMYLPKDRLANWIEHYVEALDINWWGSTEFLGGTWDTDKHRWRVSVRNVSGAERELHPRHVVFATGSGYTGRPNVPKLPGLDTFAGRVMHSSEFTDGSSFSGQRVLVVGTGTSAHDIAYDLHVNGAAVTMMQRSPTTVIALSTARTVLAGVQPFYGSGHAAWADSDLATAANFIQPLFYAYCQRASREAEGIDRDLLAGLRKAGFDPDCGPDDPGMIYKAHSAGGRYYIEIGCSKLIIDGHIQLIHSADLDALHRDGLTLQDGRQLPFDAIVLATGYHSHETDVERWFGADVARRIGEVGGFAEDGEIRNGWRRTAQDGLWFMVSGGLAGSRIYSRYLALQINAALHGLLPQRTRQET